MAMTRRQQKAMFAKMNSPRASPMRPFIIRGNTVVNQKTGDVFFKDDRRGIAVERKDSKFVTAARPEERRKVSKFFEEPKNQKTFEFPSINKSKTYYRVNITADDGIDDPVLVRANSFKEAEQKAIDIADENSYSGVEVFVNSKIDSKVDLSKIEGLESNAKSNVPNLKQKINKLKASGLIKEKEIN